MHVGKRNFKVHKAVFEFEDGEYLTSIYTQLYPPFCNVLVFKTSRGRQLKCGKSGHFEYHKLETVGAAEPYIFALGVSIDKHVTNIKAYFLDLEDHPNLKA